MKKLLMAAIALLSAATMSVAQSESVTIKGPNAPISAVYHKPEGLAEGQKCPLVIICHGFGSNKEAANLRQIALELEKKGMATLLFDFSGCGASVVEKKFTFEDMTVATEIEDLKAVVKYAKELPFVKDIALMGHSMGGAVALVAASDLGKRTVKSLALMAPALSLREDAIRGQIFDAKFDPYDIPRKIEVWNGAKVLRRDYIREAQKVNFFKKAADYKGKTLVVVGDHDTVVPYTYGEYLKVVMPDADLKVYEDYDHSLVKNGEAESYNKVVEKIVSFLAGELL